MAGLTLDEAAGIIKEVYLPVVREQLNNKVMLLAQLEKGNENVEGEEAIVSLHLQRNSGVSAIAEGGTLPTPGNQKAVKSRTPLRTVAARARLTAQVLKAMRSDRSSFVRPARDEMKRIETDARRQINRMLWGTSDGVIAQCGTTNTSTTVTMATGTTAVAMRQLEKGLAVDIGTVASPTTIASARTITSVNRSAKTFVISGATVSTTGSHYVFIAGSGGSGASQVELTGMQTIVDSTGELFSVDPATYDVWSSYEDTNTNAFSEPLFEKVMDEIDIASGEEIDLIATTHGVVRAVANQYQAKFRHQPPPATIKGGFPAIEFSAGGRTAALVRDRDCPMGSTTAGSVFFLNTDHLRIDEWAEWDAWAPNGSVWNQVPDKLEQEATFFTMIEQTTDQRNAHGKLTKVTEAG